MDKVIAGLPAAADGDLMLCVGHGVAFQRDWSHRVVYDAAYFDKCRGYEGQAIALAINAGRIGLVDRHAGGATEVCDVGIGSGEFISCRVNVRGYDINPAAVAWLKARGKLVTELAGFAAYTFWDVIEHVAEPEAYFRAVQPGAYLFTSLPIFADLACIRQSKHYRPGEHLYYWTERGFVDWMAAHRFALLERSDFETRAGRDNILSFAFRKME